MKLTLRDYQEEALAALYAGWAKGLTRLAVVLPTGTGKTVCFAELMRRAQAEGHRGLVLVHRDELVKQAVDKLRSTMPGVTIGVIKAEQNDVDAPVIVASVQTLSRDKRLAQVRDIGMIVVDEAHHAMADTYLKVLRALGSFDGVPTSGWSATLVRDDSKGLGDVWEKVAYERDILWFIDHDPPYLVDPRGKQVTIDGLNLGQVARSRGEYQEGSLGDALIESGAGEQLAKAYLKEARDEQGNLLQGILFAPSVASAIAFAADFNAAGIPTEVVVGTTPLEERELIYKRVRAGEVMVLANCMVLTEGFDLPQLACAVIARFPSNPGLYVQMAGRVLRLWPGKLGALILDAVGATGRHKLATIADLSKTEVKPEPGETLTEARERMERERAGVRDRMKGKLGSVEVDLFHSSRSVWLRTRAGKWFISTRDKLFFLWERVNGNVNVGWKPRRSHGGGWLVENVSLEYGMAWAEQAASTEDPSITQRDARWRRRGASERQVQLLRDLGFKVEGKMNQGEASDLLSVHFASRSLDPKRR